MFKGKHKIIGEGTEGTHSVFEVVYKPPPTFETKTELPVSNAIDQKKDKEAGEEKKVEEGNPEQAKEKESVEGTPAAADNKEEEKAEGAPEADIS